MELQTTADTFRVRFAFSLDRLKSVLRNWGVSSGSVADLEPFAERLETPGAFAEALAATLRAVMRKEETAPTRMELLELLCIAVSGTDVEGSGPALRRPLREMLVFINGVLLSMQEPLANKPGEKAPFRVAELEDGHATSAVHDSPTDSAHSAVDAHMDTFSAAVTDTDKPYVIPERTPERPALPEADEDDGPGFYILESFGQVAHATPLAAAPARAPSEPVESDGPSSPVAAIATVSAVAPASWTPTVAPRKESSGGLSEERVGQNVSAMTLPASTTLKRTVSDAGSGFEERPGRTDLRIGADAEVDEVEVDENAGVGARGRAKAGRFLSQPALLACAVVVGFAGGMLVPRYKTQLYKPQRTSASVGSVPADMSRLNAAAPRPAQAAQTALPLSPLPPLSSLPSSPPPSSLPQTVPAAEQGPGVDVGVPATAFLKVGGGTTATIPANTALRNLIYSPQPQYPSLARLTHAEGDVDFAIVVSPQGSVIATHVLGGQPLLRGAAENAVRHWRFRPFVANGKPAQIQTSVVVNVRPPL